MWAPSSAIGLEARRDFVFGRTHETGVSMTLRANWTFSPHLALQVYAQPYIASGRYTELKDVDSPGAARYADRFHAFTGDEIQLTDGTYHVARGGSSFSFARPDFNFRQLRSSVVVRWEYRPGSTVFATWSHGQTSDGFDGGRFRLGRDLPDLGTTPRMPPPLAHAFGAVSGPTAAAATSRGPRAGRSLACAHVVGELPRSRHAGCHSGLRMEYSRRGELGRGCNIQSRCVKRA